jgi:hypothetical protein
MYGLAAPAPQLCDEGPVLDEPACKRGRWSWQECRRTTWAGFATAQQAGLTRAIGVSNFETWMLQELSPPAAVNQVLFHLGFHDDHLQAVSAAQGTVTQARVFRPSARRGAECRCGCARVPGCVCGCVALSGYVSVTMCV